MKELIDFIDKWKGKQLQILPSSIENGRGECFDTVAEWCNVLGILHYPENPSPFPYQYAYQIYFSFGTWQAQYFTRIANGLFNAPQAGDIVVFKPGYNGGPGHVVVATGNSNLWGFEAFSQNDPLGSNCQIKWYNYGFMQNNGVYGWLHPKILDKITDTQFRNMVNEKIETQITDTYFRDWVRELLKK